ncbi:hypothetical protein [Halomarina oriensis]|uniref:Uncharacterized protein n=1 Tax=Halomarina oriensis TaxID=671145 RepID=A0A6B0GWP4_9EURY|nr:hypothetical protein [Halomarina oriensis]MWG36565.1 hypothetical protein [Halomarina oriensis]
MPVRDAIRRVAQVLGATDGAESSQSSGDALNLFAETWCEECHSYARVDILDVHTGFDEHTGSCQCEETRVHASLEPLSEQR